MNTRSSKNEKLSSYVPGHIEAASTNLAKLWNNLDLKSARSITEAKMLVKKHLKDHLDLYILPFKLFI